DGHVVPAETKASFSKSGDALAWVTARGAYFDAENNLRADLGGRRDRVLPERPPTELGPFLQRLLAPDSPVRERLAGLRRAPARAFLATLFGVNPGRQRARCAPPFNLQGATHT